VNPNDRHGPQPISPGQEIGARPSTARRQYWRRQLRRTTVLLLVWAIVGFGLSILFVEELNQIHFGDMPLGFWMAQQGSIYVFIVLILAYALMMERADREMGMEDERYGHADAGSSTEGH